MINKRRKNIRLKGFDYSSEGGYFITIVTKAREPLFGKVVNGEMVLSEMGEIVQEEWVRSAEIRSEIEIDEFVVMPNHFHAIVHIIINQSDEFRTGDRRSTFRTGDRPVAPTTNGPKPRSLGALIAGFKSAVTTRINQTRNTPGMPVWQRNYYDHIIGTDREYEQIAEYIANNPLNWGMDKEHPI